MMKVIEGFIERYGKLKVLNVWAYITGFYTLVATLSVLITYSRELYTIN